MMLCFVAKFGFGQEVGAIAAWANGEDLDMIKANDEKSKKIALVCKGAAIPFYRASLSLYTPDSALHLSTSCFYLLPNGNCDLSHHWLEKLVNIFVGGIRSGKATYIHTTMSLLVLILYSTNLLLTPKTSGHPTNSIA